MTAKNLTAERVREVLDYDPETGVFTWRIATSNRVKAGGVAGSAMSTGYVEIGLDGGSFLAHRLAWFSVTGAWPTDQIDHKDGHRANNRWANLRAATNSVNAQNRRHALRNNVSGLLGVAYDPARNRYVASIWISGRQKNLGRFATAIEAHEAYLAAKRRLHEGCTI